MNDIDPLGATIYPFPMANTGKKSPMPPSSATEEAGATPVAPVAVQETKETARGFLQVGRRNLTEEELSTPAARRFLLFEIERLDRECDDARSFTEKYHDQRVIIATLTESSRTSRWNEILSFVCLSVGSAGIGAAPGYLGVSGAEKFGLVFFGLSVVLVLAGIGSRVLK